MFETIDARDKETALYIACGGAPDIAMDILQYPDICGLDIVCSESEYTCLMKAISKKSTEVAMEILKYPERCRLGYTSTYDSATALYLACVNGMDEVALKILGYSDLSSPLIEGVHG
jgi:hypothetical protein